MKHATKGPQASEGNVFADPILWQVPEIDTKTGEIKGENSVEGTFVGFTPFEFEPGVQSWLVTIDTGNEEFFALPDWFKIRMCITMNPERVIQGQTKLKLVFNGYEALSQTEKMTKCDLYADGVKLGKPLLSLEQLKQIHGGSALSLVREK